ncbi:hypothetical protein ACEWY4_007078 [Coilia grayii]|uniref:Gypsy retrotransposon integrase-like protein 1 n=1 Tax=Coilia grayii TaxID=363190 RepID=A0ABD1KF90_9TELE
MSTGNTNGDGAVAPPGGSSMQAPSHSLAAGALPTPTTPLFVFPWFSGSSGMPKFTGEKTGAAFSQWKDNLASMFRIQNIPPNMQKELVLSSLEGEARRQVMILAENNRDTTEKLFDHLGQLYGDKVPASVLRSMYFNCRQESRESVRAFSLRLQELFQRLKRKDGGSLAREDVLLRDQFIDGQRDVVLRRELRTKLLLNPNISFLDIQQEAIIRTEAYGEEEVAAHVYYTEQVRPTTSSDTTLAQVKDELRKEIMGEIKQQMTSLSQGILQELRSEIKPWAQNLGTKLKDASSWLAIRAANGLSVPYIGYACLEVCISSVRLPSCGVVIVNDDCLSGPPGLLGMNVIQDCWDHLFKGAGLGAQPAPLQATTAGQEAWCRALKMVEEGERFASPDGRVGYVRLTNRHPVKIPANSEVLLCGRTRPGPRREDYECIIEPICVHPGVSSARILATVRRGRVMVKLRNVGLNPVYVYRNQRVGEVWYVKPTDAVLQPEVNMSWVGQQMVEVSLQPGQNPIPDVPMPEVEFDLTGVDLSSAEQVQLKALLMRYHSVFAKSDEDYGRTGVVQHHINTGQAPPIRERYRQIPPHLYQDVRLLLQGMLDGGIVRKSTSPWAAPIVLVRKRNGEIRFCVDYRKLNTVTHKDAYPLPRIEEALTTLKKARYFSTLDLASGYWQVEMAPEDREKTAFTTPMGLFEFERMPFGLCNAPATFQRLMEACLGDMNTEALLIYLDDVIVFADDFATHLKNLEAVFSRLLQFGLKLRPAKCSLLRSSVQFLGHVVTREGVAPDPEKVAAVQSWKAPTSVTELRGFLGFVGYYRRFIEGFSRIAAPLHGLLVGISPKQKKAHLGPWTAACELAFNTLKDKLTSAPVLAFADFTRPFILYTDASLHGLGAVLTQKDGGKERVIAFASRSLSPSEKNDANYSSFKLEFLALKWAVTEKFKEYLLGATFTVYTDNNPLCHYRTTTLGAVEQRWAARLDNFNFSLCYRPGRVNGNADALSRRTDLVPEREVPEDDGTEVPTFHHRRPEPPGCQAAMAEYSGSVVESLVSGQSMRQWQQEQQSDPVVSGVLFYLSKQRKPDAGERLQEDAGVMSLLRQWNRLAVRDGVLWRCYQDPGSQEIRYQLILPAIKRMVVWHWCHEKAGHFGPEKTLSLIRSRFFWVGLEADVKQWCSACSRCVLHKKPVQVAKAPLVPVEAFYPMQLVSVDFLKVDCSSNGLYNILVAVDHFTKFAWAMPTADQTAVTTARALWRHVFQQFGPPQQLHSDQGANFSSNLIRELCKLYGVQKSQTTPYHPAGNGACERFNRTLIQLLGMLADEQKNRWPEYIAELVFLYNNTVHSSTGCTPFYMMYGRHGRLPLDLALGAEAALTEEPTDGWVQRHFDRLQYAHQFARSHLQRSNVQQKLRYDSTAKGCPLLPGEQVLVKRLGPRACGKLTDFWEEVPYIVVRQPNPQNPVYVVRPVQGGGDERVLHRNLLRPCSLNLEGSQPGPLEHAEVSDVPPRMPWIMFVPEIGAPGEGAGLMTNPHVSHGGPRPADDTGDEEAAGRDPPMGGQGQPPEQLSMQPDGDDLRRSTRPTRGVPPSRFMFTE